MNTLVKCVDCKFYITWFSLSDLERVYRCAHPELTNTVTGKPDKGCEDARNETIYCGPSGDKFEERNDR